MNILIKSIGDGSILGELNTNSLTSIIKNYEIIKGDFCFLKIESIYGNTTIYMLYKSFTYKEFLFIINGIIRDMLTIKGFYYYSFKEKLFNLKKKSYTNIKFATNKIELTNHKTKSYNGVPIDIIGNYLYLLHH